MMPKSPYRRYVDLKADRLVDPEGFSQNSWIDMQGALFDALWQHVRSVRDLPDEMASDLAFAMEDVIAGHENDLLMPHRRRGRPKRPPTQDNCIRDAVRYMRAVKAGLIEDPQPIRTVVNAFRASTKMRGDLNRRTVQKWLSDDRFSGVASDDFESQMIVSLMKASGWHYSRNFTLGGRK